MFNFSPKGCVCAFTFPVYFPSWNSLKSLQHIKYLLSLQTAGSCEYIHFIVNCFTSAQTTHSSCWFFIQPLPHPANKQWSPLTSRSLCTWYNKKWLLTSVNVPGSCDVTEILNQFSQIRHFDVLYCMWCPVAFEPWLSCVIRQTVWVSATNWIHLHFKCNPAFERSTASRDDRYKQEIL